MQGLVVGDLHTLLDILADTKVRKQGLARGFYGLLLRKPFTSAISGGKSAWWQPRLI